MQIQQSSNYNFTGIKLRNVKIRKIVPEETIVPVSFVEFKQDSKQDLKTLYLVSELWKNNYFVNNMFARQANLYAGRCRNDGYKIFAVTTQDKKFGKLDPNKILSLAFVQKRVDGSAKIHFLESKREGVPETFVREYKDAGKGILRCLKDTYNKIVLFAERKSLIKYYESEGFVSFSKNAPQYMGWSR